MNPQKVFASFSFVFFRLMYYDFKLKFSFHFFQNLSVSVSVLTLTFIAYDRYNAICRPLQFSTRKSKAAVVIGKVIRCGKYSSSSGIINFHIE